MQTQPTTTVSIIHLCEHLSERVIRNREKLRRRLLRAIEEMVEDGFTNFILPIEKYSPFPTTAIDALLDAKAQHPNICLTIMLPYFFEDGVPATTAKHNAPFVQYADKIIYYKKEYIRGEPNLLNHNLLSQSSALIIYYDRNSTLLNYITHQAQRQRLPFANINIWFHKKLLP